MNGDHGQGVLRPTWGWLAEFETAEQLIDAAHRAQKAGFQQTQCYSPFPLDELPRAMGIRRSRLPWAVLIGGLIGGSGAYFMQWYAFVISYRINVGGRPLDSWPSFLPVTFELTVLSASLIGLAALFVFNKFPWPHHPLFRVPEFTRATVDRFFLCIPAMDPQFGSASEFLRQLQPLSLHEVADDSVPERLGSA